MTILTEKIVTWLASNPGRHTAGAIADGIGFTSHARGLTSTLKQAEFDGLVHRSRQEDGARLFTWEAAPEVTR